MRFIIIAICICCVGCSGQFKHQLEFNPTEPIRVAVLPFAQLDKDGKIVDIDNSLLIDDVALISSTTTETPAEYVRKLVQNELNRSGLDIIPIAVVEGKLTHNGFSDSDLKIDLPKIFATNAFEYCQSLLGCDAVLYGKVTNWDRSYYGLQSSSTVGIELKLIAAQDGKVLFESKAVDSDSRGLSKGPTGFSNLVIEPIKGLDNQIILDLARSTVTKMLSPLFVQGRPEYLETSPPAIFASAHDANNGMLSFSKPLTVIAYASPGESVYFSIGQIIQNIPMVERDSGHYIGEYYPLKTDRFQNAAVRVSITDRFGRTTNQKLGRSEISLQ